METPSPTVTRVGDMTLDELRKLIRREIEVEQHQKRAVKEIYVESDLSDFPVDDLGPWPEGLTFSREEMYGDDGR